MPRTSRPNHLVPNQPNHIVVRANNRRRLFSYPHERITYLRLLSSALRANACVLNAICLVTNHGHLLLTPPSVAAGSQCIKQVNQRYAQARNRRRGGSGKLFEERFYSRPVTSEEQFVLTMMYIEANPHRAGLHDPDQYPWSSLGIHAGTPAAARIPTDLIALDPWYRALAPSPAEQGQVYRRIFSEYLDNSREPLHAVEVGQLERRDPQAERRRLLRPDGTSAAEPTGFYVSRQEPNDDEVLGG